MRQSKAGAQITGEKLSLGCLLVEADTHTLYLSRADHLIMTALNVSPEEIHSDCWNKDVHIHQKRLQGIYYAFV